jgi:DNA-binding NarL/FixJ family response regulator
MKQACSPLEPGAIPSGARGGARMDFAEIEAYSSPKIAGGGRGKIHSLLNSQTARMKHQDPIKIAIGCPNYLYGEGLKKILEEEGMEVVGIFNEGVDYGEVGKMNPDVALIDLNIFPHLPGSLGRNKRTRVLILGEWPPAAFSDERLSNLISRGVVGILPWAADSSLLIKAINAVLSGELWLDRKTMGRMVSQGFKQEGGKKTLTKTEKEIVSLICEGFRNKEIAQKLDITERTVKSHCNRIYKKVGLTDRLQLATHVYKEWPEWFRGKRKSDSGT